MSYEIIPTGSAFHWRLINKVTGRIVVDNAPRAKAIEIKRNLEANIERRKTSMEAGQ